MRITQRIWSNNNVQIPLSLYFKMLLPLASVCMLMLISACKKKDFIQNTSNPQDKQVLRMLDSIYLYASQIYFWNDQLPNYKTFNPSRFYDQGSEDIQVYRNEIFELTRYAKNPKSGQSYEYNIFAPTLPKYSTIIGAVNTSNSSNNEAKQDYNIQNAFGLAFALINNNEIWVLYVDPNSAAGRAGINRGNRVTKINGQAVQLSSEFYTIWSTALKAIYVELEIVGPKGETRLVKLGQREYDPNPVLKYKILNSNSRRFGFFTYNNFTNVENTIRYLQPVFYFFQNEGISDLIIDLRYNGGGYQNTAQYIANNIVPEKLNGSVMFTEHYNMLMQKGKADILLNQPLLDFNNQPIIIDGKVVTLFDFDYSLDANTIPFEKEGPLTGIKNIYFIVSRHTASSSELLINVLKPYLNVKLIGVSDGENAPVRTYGKPVGFFDINLPNYKLYMAMYNDKNAKGEGDFFDGFVADFSTGDMLEYDFGSIEDPAIQWILDQTDGQLNKNNLMKNNSRRALSKREPVQYFFNNKGDNFMIKNPKSLKLKK